MRKTDPLERSGRRALSLQELSNGLLEDEVESNTLPDGAMIVMPSGDDDSYRIGKAEIALGAEFPDDLDDDEIDQIGALIAKLDTSLQWVIGDFANYVKRRKDMSFSEIAERYGFAVETLYTYAWVAREFETSTRRRGLTFTHHRLLAGVEDLTQRDYLLHKTLAEGMSTKDLENAIRRLNRPTLPARKPDNSLFSNEKRPKTTGMKGIASRAGRGDEQAKEQLRAQLDQFRQWCNDVEREFLGKKK